VRSILPRGLNYRLLLFVSDDDDEEEAPNTGDDAQVKPEPGQQIVKKDRHRQGTPSYELHIYTVEELQQFKQRDMVADTELLDGRC
jgi:structural maintenance of chromosome 4